jgi:hypothetical protein
MPRKPTKSYRAPLRPDNRPRCLDGRLAKVPKPKGPLPGEGKGLTASGKNKHGARSGRVQPLSGGRFESNPRRH